MSNTPQIRFAGFTDAWEQRKLSELFEERNEQAPMSEDYPLMAFIANIGVAPKGDRYDRSALVHDEKGKKYKRTEKGDFIYSSNNLETGSIGLNNYGNACISPVYSIFKSKHTVDPEFMGRILLRKEFINQMVCFRQGVVYGQWKIHEDDFLNLTISVPKTEEQQEIGKFFAHIDSLITLHQRKCDALQKFKKSMLQKMFPQNGESVPEIRFAGFTDAWEQRKLGDICPTFLDGDWIESKDQSDSGVRLIQTGNIGVGTYIEKEDRAKWVSEDTFNRLHCEEVFAGDILISRLPEPAGRACIVPETGLKMITAVDVTIARTSDEYDSNFILQFLCSDNYFKAVGNTLSGSTRQRISRSNLEQIPVPIAPTMQEQEQVGAFFSQLDNLITLHQRKLETLQKMKKSLLQKMFV